MNTGHLVHEPTLKTIKPSTYVSQHILENMKEKKKSKAKLPKYPKEEVILKKIWFLATYIDCLAVSCWQNSQPKLEHFRNKRIILLN